MLEAFEQLRAHEVVADGRTHQLAFDRKTTLGQIIGQLQEQDLRVYQMALDLHDKDGVEVARALSHARHAVRHAVQLNMFDGSFTPEQYQVKRREILESCAAGEALLKPLCDSAYRLLRDQQI
ncbi:hypothetical protein D9T17_01040 [Lysobacter enzymogenes]|uniref:Uncharacterized protein n=2 Tax=Lysobacter enzymogenes TaxID=69 RepID=A0A3N2RQ24_LYSEN|nr:hypothetical protein D9T17_01040 [Lysobacter enzymogenes]